MSERTADEVGMLEIEAGIQDAVVSEIGLRPAAFADSDEFTWGLVATGAHKSAFKGRGVRVAVACESNTAGPV